MWKLQRVWNFPFLVRNKFSDFCHTARWWRQCGQKNYQSFWTLATNGANMCVCVTWSDQPLPETETSVTVYTGQSTESFCFFRWKPQTVTEVMQRRWPAALAATSYSSSVLTARALIHASVVAGRWVLWLILALGLKGNKWWLLCIVPPSVGISATGRSIIWKQQLPGTCRLLIQTSWGNQILK